MSYPTFDINSYNLLLITCVFTFIIIIIVIFFRPLAQSCRHLTLY